ncbi:LysE family translocator [Parasalinivibrio latis]|uniref:LysE family translocator n=1 Tax=Parasalinivibrio latis TaxID=2952610 RepID=UPI0030E3DB4F
MTDWTLVMPLAVFALTTSGTPGPNNMMLTASGANFGFIRTLPHMVGISAGMVLLILSVAAGLGVIFQTFPAVQEGFKWAASGYLLFLAWKIATAEPSSQKRSSGSRPMSFWAAAMFQFVNPKAWMMAISSISTFTVSGDNYWLSAMVVCAAFVVVGLPAISVWAGFGVMLGRLISHPRSWRVFNGTMGVLTAGCLVFIWA